MILPLTTPPMASMVVKHTASPSVTKPTFEHHHSGLGLGRSDPRISWRFETDRWTVQDWIQTAYEIEVMFVGCESQLYNVDSEQSVLVPWPARDLKSRESADVRVRVYGQSSSASSGAWTEWSPISTVEAALLHSSDFRAKFITARDRIGPNGPLQPVRFRKVIQLQNVPDKDARLYITAMGVFRAWVNGHQVGDEEMAPGWQSYHSRLNYRIWKTPFLVAGRNEITIEAAEGWYCGRLGFRGGKRFLYGKEIGVMAQLEVGGNVCVATDETWICGPSGTISAEIYAGEVFDASRDEEEPILPTRILPWPSAKLIAPDGPPVRITDKVPAVKVFKSKSGKTLVDFGQNLVGKLSVQGLPKEKRTVTFRHAEVLENGELCTRPLRTASATDTIILDGRITSWTPKFTFHGFRYVEVEGWEPSAAQITALVMHTDLQRRGTFRCSNNSINKLHQNVVWSMRGNFLSVPTDCPQRDERLGWTGDAQVFAPTASFLYDTIGMLGEWLQDVASEQRDGIVPFVVPDIKTPQWPHMPNAVWDDVAVLMPKTLYEYSSDKELVMRQYHSMKSWLDQGVSRDTDTGLWNPDIWQAADWLDPTAPPDDPGLGATDPTYVADAYLVHVTKVYSELCAAIRNDEEAERYASEAEKLKQAFQHRYITPAGLLASRTQTGLALALQYDLLPEELQHKAGSSLQWCARRARFRISTGFAGTPIICHALTKAGYPQVAYRMLLETKCPSWMYPITMGATTIWERWDSMLPSGEVNPGQMTSFNHYALGAVANWLHTTVGGIQALEPGWKKVKIEPVPGGNLQWAETAFEGPYGKVECLWNRPSGSFQVSVPPNSTAVVVAEGKEVKVGSGTYHFKLAEPSAPWPPEPVVPMHSTAQTAQIAE